MGFEPTRPFGLAVFKTAALDHYATSPNRDIISEKKRFINKRRSEMGRGMHTSYSKGTPLHIILKDGSIIEGKFSDHKSGKVLLEDGRGIKLDQVRSMSIRKLEATTTSDDSVPKIKWRI